MYLQSHFTFLVKFYIISIFPDFEKVGLQLHNVFRRNHGVPFIAMAPLVFYEQIFSVSTND